MREITMSVTLTNPKTITEQALKFKWALMVRDNDGDLNTIVDGKTMTMDTAIAQATAAMKGIMSIYDQASAQQELEDKAAAPFLVQDKEKNPWGKR